MNDMHDAEGRGCRCLLYIRRRKMQCAPGSDFDPQALLNTFCPPLSGRCFHAHVYVFISQRVEGYTNTLQP